MARRFSLCFLSRRAAFPCAQEVLPCIRTAVSSAAFDGVFLAAGLLLFGFNGIVASHIALESSQIVLLRTLLGSVSVVSSLTHGNVILTEVVVPRMRHHSNDAGVLASAIPLPPDSIIAAVASSDNVEVVNEDTVLFPGDKAIVVADNQVIDAVRAAFKGL